jgi:hexosaminidase
MAQSDDWWEPGAGWAGTVTPDASYAYDPGSDWPETVRAHLVGVQANLWTENLHDRSLFDHMVFPRLCAMAETAWTPPGRKSYGRFAAIEWLMPRTDG